MAKRPLTSHKKSATVKVGVLTLVSLALLITVLIWLRGQGIASGTPYSVLFKDVDGMREGATVQMMGIRVGFVDTIKAVDIHGKYYVNVDFNINQNTDTPIPKGSRVSIEQSGIVGEKFLEITPPQLQEVVVSAFGQEAQGVNSGIPVRFLYEEGYIPVGKVERVEKTADEHLVRYKLYYRITKPGAEMPKDPVFELTLGKDSQYYLLILPREPYLTKAPDPNLTFTVENPLRIKRFLEIQMESAEALKVTNEKVNQLLSDDTIDTLNNTLKNTEVMTARATEVLDTANHMFETTGKDLQTLVQASGDLAKNVTEVSNNLNDVIGDPQLKRDIVSTVNSVEQSTKTLKELLQDPSLRETLTLTRQTTQNANELVSYLKDTAKNREVQQRLDMTLTLLDTSLTRLTTVLDNVDKLTNDDDETLRGLIDDSRETAKNMKQLTNKLNGPFTLFRLMF